jgi:hypothetical protein
MSRMAQLSHFSIEILFKDTADFWDKKSRLFRSVRGVHSCVMACGAAHR